MKDAGVVSAIALGGALGATARYGLTVAVPPSSGTFPVATFVANIGGSLLLGALVVLSVEVWRPTRLLRPFAGTGLLGGFTTFSTFTVETRDLIADHHLELAAAYALGSVGLALLAVRTGAVLTRRLAHIAPEEMP